MVLQASNMGYKSLSVVVYLTLFSGVCQALCRSPHLFTCDDNTCISKARVCDGGNDCRNGEDESFLKAGCVSEIPRCKPRNPIAATANGYTCRRPCNPSSRNPCLARRKRCICDDECGYVCVNPNSPCPRRRIPFIPNVIGYDVIRFNGNARVLVNDPPSFKHRDMIKYACRQGMTLVGPLPRCNSFRRWTRQLPICKTDHCAINRCLNGGTCVNRANSFVCFCPTTHAGRQCENELFDPCRSGPCKNGGTCHAIGQYSQECECRPGFSGPYCEEETFCSKPVPLSRGFTEEDREEWRYGETVTFECLDDFTLFGNSTIQCMENGEWSEQEAKCIRSICILDYLLLAEDIIVSGLEDEGLYGHKFNVGDEATLECQPGLRPFRNDTPFSPSVLQCEYGGRWMPHYSEISCESLDEVMCEPPDLPENLTLSEVLDMSQLSEGTELRGQCHEGFTLVGNEVFRCLNDGTWSEIPICEREEVTEPPTTCEYPHLPHGLLVVEFSEILEFRPGAVLHARCTGGLDQIGDERIVCLENGTWSEPPRCHEEIVENVPEPECVLRLTSLGEGIEIDVIDGEEIEDLYAEGDTVDLFCSDLNKRPYSNSIGVSNVVTCSENGTWHPSVEDIVCVQVCRRPQTPEDGMIVINVQAELYFPDDTLYSECPPLYRPAGNNEIRCMDDGSWSEMAPCQPVGCWVDRSRLDSSVAISGHNAGSLANVEFPVGHELEIECANTTNVFEFKLPSITVCQGKNIWSQDYTLYACHSATCENRCLETEGPCSCDFECEERGDCCDDFLDACRK